VRLAIPAIVAASLGACAGDDGDGGVDPHTLPHFSFFVTSLQALQDLSGNQLGFGGDLRFGLVGPNAGIRGADLICTTIAERSLAGAGGKQWRAFLSAGDDGTGQPVHAIERIGPGPWYDRLGRMFAPDRASLLSIRPQGGDPIIRNDFPNEHGVPNHDPDGTGEVDNHDMLTGSNAQGHFEGPTRTCLDWTANAGDEAVEGEPRVGHSWPRDGSDFELNSWISSLVESGCAPGVSLIEMGPPDPRSNTVGSGGGYGGFYCFALIP
jgi:hypothetical protein